MNVNPENQVRSNPENQVRSNPENQVRSNPENQVRSNPGNQVRSNPGNQVRSNPKKNNSIKYNRKNTQNPTGNSTSTTVNMRNTKNPTGNSGQQQSPPPPPNPIHISNNSNTSVITVKISNKETPITTTINQPKPDEPHFLIINYDEDGITFFNIGFLNTKKKIIKEIIEKIKRINPTVIVCCTQFSPSCIVIGNNFQHYLNTAIDEETKKKGFNYSLISKVEATTPKKSSKMYCAKELLFDKRFKLNNVRTRIYGNNNELYVNLKNKRFLNSVRKQSNNDSSYNSRLYNSRLSNGNKSDINCKKYYIKHLNYRRINGSDKGIGAITHNIVLSSCDDKYRYQNIFSNYNLNEKVNKKILNPKKAYLTKKNILDTMLTDRIIKANKILEYDPIKAIQTDEYKKLNQLRSSGEKFVLTQFFDNYKFTIFMISTNGIKKYIGNNASEILSTIDNPTKFLSIIDNFNENKNMRIRTKESSSNERRKKYVKIDMNTKINPPISIDQKSSIDRINFYRIE